MKMHLILSLFIGLFSFVTAPTVSFAAEAYEFSTAPRPTSPGEDNGQRMVSSGAGVGNEGCNTNDCLKHLVNTRLGDETSAPSSVAGADSTSGDVGPTEKGNK